MNKVIFFDLETTGTDLAKDRIVSYHFIKIDGDEKIIKTKHINPTIPIPQEASEIHGITDDMVKDAPTFAEVAPYMHEFLQGYDLAGYNILRFDVPILAEELARCNIHLNIKSINVIDVCNIWRNLYPNNLSFVYSRLTGKKLEDAHDAGADNLATVEVMEALKIRHHEELDSLDKIVELSRLGNQKNEFADYAGKLAYDDDGDVVFTFGKHKDKKVKDNPDYADWMMRGEFPATTKKVLMDITSKIK